MLSICEKLAVVTDDSVFSYLKVLKFIRSAKWVYFTPQTWPICLVLYIKWADHLGRYIQ